MMIVRAGIHHHERVLACVGSGVANCRRHLIPYARVADLQDRDRRAIRAKVVDDFNATQAQLEGDLNREHTALWNKLNGGIGGINAGLDALRHRVNSREGAMLEFDETISSDQRAEVR